MSERQPLSAWRLRRLKRALTIAVFFQSPAIVWLAIVLSQGAHLAPWLAWSLSVGLHLGHLTITLRRMIRWLDDHRVPLWHTWLLDAPAASYASACLVGGVPGVLALLVLAVMHLAHVHHPSALVVLSAVYVPSLVMTAWGTTVGRIRPVVRVRELTVKGLPANFDGYRIVQLSDIHCGPYLPRWVYRMWARTALAQQPDLVAVTGDFITSGNGYVGDVEDLFRHLKAPDGVVACLGNHDYFNTVSQVGAAITAGGGRVLRNEGMTVARDNAKLWIAGIDDRWSKRDDLDAALAHKPAGAPTVLLAHDPEQFTSIALAGVELTLSGHTHGGQFAMPWVPLLNLARLRAPYTVGVFRQRESVMYVHQGNGTTGPPTRVGAPPEVAVLVLRAPA